VIVVESRGTANGGTEAPSAAHRAILLAAASMVVAA